MGALSSPSLALAGLSDLPRLASARGGPLGRAGAGQITVPANVPMRALPAAGAAFASEPRWAFRPAAPELPVPAAGQATRARP